MTQFNLVQTGTELGKQSKTFPCLDFRFMIFPPCPELPVKLLDSYYQVIAANSLDGKSFVILWQALPGRSRGPPMTAFTDLGQESAPLCSDKSFLDKI